MSRFYNLCFIAILLRLISAENLPKEYSEHGLSDSGFSNIRFTKRYSYNITKRNLRSELVVDESKRKFKISPSNEKNISSKDVGDIGIKIKKDNVASKEMVTEEKDFRDAELFDKKPKSNKKSYFIKAAEISKKRFKRRINTTNILARLKNMLAPKLSIRTVSVNLNWTNYAKNYKSPFVGSTLTLYDGNEPVAHIMNIPDRNNFHTICGLEQDRIYKGSVKLLTDVEETKNFFRDEIHGSNLMERFELSTPFIVSDADIRSILETKEILENKLKNEEPVIAAMYVDINLMFPKIDKLGYIVEISRHRLESNATTISAVEKTIQLFPPVKGLTLSYLSPHELLKISLKNVINKDNDDLSYNTVHSVNIFTGSAYKLGLTNLSRLIENDDSSNENSSTSESHNGTAAILINDFIGDSGRRSVRCYTDDDVFSGYPCRNSDICIPQDWVCDGESDCRGRDDERGCDDETNNYDDEYFSRGSCRKYEFRCRSRGQSVCLPNSWLCDGRVDCHDGWDEDEENCYQSYNTVRPGFTSLRDYFETDCNHNHFRCWTSKDCVAPRLVCDGHEDCLDGSDERICENWSERCDLGFEFKCYKSSQPSDTFFNRKCIPRSWVCDDQADCSNGEDESYRICRNFHRFSLANILAPLGIDFMINTGFNRA